jgi:hypothetical protein
MMSSIILGCVILVLIVVTSSERAEAIAELNDPVNEHLFKSRNKG